VFFSPLCISFSVVCLFPCFFFFQGSHVWFPGICGQLSVFFCFLTSPRCIRGIVFPFPDKKIPSRPQVHNCDQELSFSVKGGNPHCWLPAPPFLPCPPVSLIFSAKGFFFFPPHLVPKLHPFRFFIKFDEAISVFFV